MAYHNASEEVAALGEAATGTPRLLHSNHYVLEKV